MNIHISTPETFMHGAIAFKGKCVICQQDDQELRSGYVDTHCAGCGRYASHEDPPSIVRQRREHLGLTRKEMGKEMMVKHSTVSNYENFWPSKRYWLDSAKLVAKGLE